MDAPRKHLHLFPLIIFSALALLAAVPLAFASESPAPRLKVAASIFSLADMARQIGGDQVEVATILPSGGNPHTFEFSPGKIGELEGVAIVFAVGHGFDDWLHPAGESFGGARIVIVDSGVDLITDGSEAVIVDGTADPHYWLSLRNARQIAENIAEELGPLVSEKETVEANLKRYLEKLSQADLEIKALFSGLSRRKVVTAHNAWAYFARDYGLEILGSLESRGHGEPTPKHLTELGRQIQREKIRALLVQPQIPRDIIRAFAEDFHLEIYELDPVEAPREGEGYTDVMLRNARIIKQALET